MEIIKDEVHILPTGTTPDVILNPNGTISIKGRAIDENIAKAHEQIMNWIDAFLLSPAELTKVSIALEYLNSVNTIVITSILKKITMVVLQGKKLDIQWYYEEDDEDIYERGKEISSTINYPIKFIVTNTLADC
jgi:hypothetical protein